jgi:phage repressor protein C with HTH and peptisase S24 domain
MQDPVTQRFIIAHNEILSANLVRSSRQFAIKLEYLPQSLSEILKGRRKVPLDLLRKMCIEFDICSKYLIEGIGSPFKSDENRERDNNVLMVVTDDSNNERIVHIPYRAQAGYGGQLANPEYFDELPTYTLPFDNLKGGTFRSFEIAGDSMEPTLYQGDKLVCAFIEPESWRSRVKDFHVYIVITNYDIVVKRIENRTHIDGTFILHSDNDYYPPRVLNGDEVKEIWYPRLKMCSFMASPKNVRNSFHNEIDNLKDTISSQNSLIKELNSTIEKLLKLNRSR